MRTGTAVPVPIALSCGASGVNAGYKPFVIVASVLELTRVAPSAFSDEAGTLADATACSA